MKCPSCQSTESKVLESRDHQLGEALRRRRECLQCALRFTTYERIEERPIMVLKKDGTKQIFNGEKLLKGLWRAFEKRPIQFEVVENIVHEIERSLQKSFVHEIPSSVLGELVLEKIYHLDQVAYVRFASVYRKFTSLEEFTNLANELNQFQQIQTTNHEEVIRN